MSTYLVLRFDGISIIEAAMIHRAHDLHGHLTMSHPRGVDIVTRADRAPRYIEAFTQYEAVVFAGAIEAFEVTPAWREGYDNARLAGYSEAGAALEVRDAQRAGTNPARFACEMQQVADDWHFTD